MSFFLAQEFQASFIELCLAKSKDGFIKASHDLAARFKEKGTNDLRPAF